MDSDFHYYGTGTAAFAAGFNKKDSQQIAFAAQFVDWFDSDYWCNWNIVDSKGNAVKNKKTKKQYVYDHPQLSIQTIGWKLAIDYDQDIWIPFHFPPGNLPYKVQADGWKKTFCEKHIVRKTKLLKRDQNKLCRPYSKFAYDLILDTCQRFKSLSTAKGDELAELVADSLQPRVRCPVASGKQIALFLLGLRMHVFADTWAHQDFTGEQNRDINFAGVDNDVMAKDKRGKYKKTEWTGSRATDCSNVRPIEKNLTCGGHGQLGMYPDYSWLIYKYPASWLPKGKRLHERDNPKEYSEAWSWLNFVMGLCKGSKTDDDRPSPTPKEIEKVIGTWRKLSTKEQVAILKSEELWKKTSLGEDFSEDLWRKTTRGKKGATPWTNVWPLLDSTKLGLYDGLAYTRGGSINVKQNSTLHYMETAAAMHYQFCVDWIAANPKYSWKPEAPMT